MHGPGLQWKFILRVIGIILILESLFMFISAGIAYYYQGGDLNGFLWSAAITLLCGLALSLSLGFRKVPIIGKREGYLSVALSWISFALFGSLPFYLSGEIPSFTDAFFESMSGITTTGATILTHVDFISNGLLFWRSLMQWLGGMGIILFSLALMPLLGGGAAQLFDAESTGLTHDKFRPRVTQMAKRLWAIYLILTLLLIFLLSLSDMNGYDAVCHAFTTISTGGFSTHQAGIAYWNSMYIESILLVFMIIGAINFSLLYFLINGQFRKFFRDEELRWFLAIILFVGVSAGVDLFINKDYPLLLSFRTSVFQVVSIITTTGFSTCNYSLWGPFYLFLFILLMIVCGCAGSTSGGLKTVRAVVLIKNTFCEFKRLIHPRAIIPVRLNGSAIAFGTVQRLLAFAFLYIGILFVSWGILTLTGMPLERALGSAVSALGNVGSSLGSADSSASYTDITAFAKWYLSFLMVAGRLEIFTLLILFTPDFWKR
ncbi:MAG: TrkH family potassium uptake protein [Dysgonamonadaceae bacterium]|jgi:trk system potassium uptake protein TrkH|nr:TrkH family potassium uptake protein [Dysgonamonadaceae bacterium]